MNEQPLISIIVPVYNTEMYLDKCVTSLINQTYRNIEIILVDDGSTDNSGKMCDSYAQKDNRIKVIHQVNAGIGAAKHSGRLISQGDYLGFVDSDDYVDLDMFESMINIAIKYDAKVVLCSLYIEYGDKTKILGDSTGKIKVFSPQQMTYNVVEDKKFRNYFANKLFSKDVIDNNIIPTIRYQEDLAIMWLLMLKSNVCVYFESPKYHYLMNPNGSTSSKKLSKYYNSMKAQQIRLSMFPNDIDTAIRDMAVCKLIRTCIQIISHSNAFPSTFQTKRAVAEAYQVLKTYKYHGHMNSDYRIKLFFIKHLRKRNSLMGRLYALSLKRK